ncbi:MAG: metallophosphoesterase family protein [Candidatus Promineifilaceae bacterium]|nr:metallophosphoesterase family protein [Candidatus Promineifilaceae bacterium]
MSELFSNSTTEEVLTIGLISDTHLPARRRSLPPLLPKIFAQVELILHAGDVGELSVLDALSEIAPVVAVHGNDDSRTAQKELPLQQLVVVAGWRLLLWHGHFQERAVEMARRRDDRWEPKLVRLARRASACDARIIVFGHMHIPLCHTTDDLLLINPGALASGNFYTRQRLQTVALLSLTPHSSPLVTHVDVTSGDAVEPSVEFALGFRQALDRVSESIVAPDLLPYMEQLRGIWREDRSHLERIFRELAFPCWEGEQEAINRRDVLRAIAKDDLLPDEVRQKLCALLESETGAL